jgi:tetratricopeptide (TPR) repeat protein
MTPMKFLVRTTLLAGLVAGLAGLPALAVQSQQQQSQKPQTGQQQQQQPQTGQQQQPQPGQQPAAQAPAAPALSPAEVKAYKHFYDLPNSDTQGLISEGTDFLQKFPDSQYKGAIYSRMAEAYRQMGNDQKMFEMGEQAIKLNPNNVDMLSMMAYSIPRRIDPNDLDSTQKLQEAEDYAKRAIQLIPTMTKPANMTDERFETAKNAELSSCHSGLGLVYFYQHNIPGMITELETAVKINPTPDPTDQFLLGYAYVQAGRYADAVAPLTSCSAAVSPITSRCKQLLQTVKQHVPATPKK